MFSISMFGEEIGQWAPESQRKNWSMAKAPHIKDILDAFDATVCQDLAEDLETIAKASGEFYLTLCIDGKSSTHKKPKIANYKNGTSKDSVEQPKLPDTWTISLKFVYETDESEGYFTIPYNFCATHGLSTESIVDFAKTWNDLYYKMLDTMCARSNEVKLQMKLNKSEEEKKKADAELAELERLAKKHKKIIADK